MTDTRRYALLSAQGTACAETVLTGDEYTEKNRNAIDNAIIGGRYAGEDKPVPGTWTDVTENEAC